MNIEKISAITLKVRDMSRSVQFYSEILDLEIIYEGRNASFSSLRTPGEQDAILNLERGTFTEGWGRIIFRVKEVDKLWNHLQSKGFKAPRPSDAPWGERYFHLHDPDGHELSFATPLR